MEAWAPLEDFYYPCCECCISRPTIEVVLLVEAVGLLIERATFSDPGQAGQPGGWQGADTRDARVSARNWLSWSGFLRRIKGNGMGVVGAVEPDDTSHYHAVRTADSERRAIGAGAGSPDSAMKMQRVTRRAIAMRKTKPALLAGMTLAMTALSRGGRSRNHAENST